MSEWFWYAIAAAVLYGLHQIFTKLASAHIGEGPGGFIVEATAALIIALYLVYLNFFSELKQPVTASGVFYSVLTGLCVGALHGPFPYGTACHSRQAVFTMRERIFITGVPFASTAICKRVCSFRFK